MENYDVIVIGSGQAGSPLAKKMALLGKKTALIERRYVGGTCINDGCTPTKTLVASAKMAYAAANSEKLGVHVSSYKVNWPAIIERKNKVVEFFRDGDQKNYKETEHLDLIFGEAFFTGMKTLRVNLNDGGELMLKADLIFINTGCKAFVPEIEGLASINYLTSTSILELDEVPEHLLVLGGGYVGLEFGQMFRRFGSEVTLLERTARISPREDEDISAEITSFLEMEGLAIITNSTVTEFKNAPDGKINAVVDTDGQLSVIQCSHLLIASGRHPETSALKLEETGVATNEKGFIIVDDKLATNVPGIYALGDVNGGPAFTHISYHDYTIIFRNLLEGADMGTTNRLVPYCIFTDPPLGRVGLNETEARKQGISFKVTKMPMSSVTRAIETADTRGFLKAIVDTRSKKILGVSFLGQEAGELMTIVQMAMEGGITFDRLQYFIFAHPLYAEALNNLFLNIEAPNG